MACALDVTGNEPTAKKEATVTLKVIGANTTLRQASVNQTNVSANIDATRKSVFFDLADGRNKVVLTFFPPPAPETLDIVEDCGDGTTQPVLSFGISIHAEATFDIIAS